VRIRIPDDHRPSEERKIRLEGETSRYSRKPRRTIVRRENEQPEKREEREKKREREAKREYLD
jgi:hypothetical protein